MYASRDSSKSNILYRNRQLLTSIVFLLIIGLTLTACDSGGETTEKPAAPLFFVATPGNAVVTLTWPTVAGAVRYRLYWATDNEFSDVMVLDDVSSSFVHDQRENGTTYYYALSALNDGGESARSTTVQARPLQAPAQTAMTQSVASGNIVLTWGDVGEYGQYDLYVATQSGITPENINTLQGGMILEDVSNPYTFDQAQAGVIYYFAVSSTNIGGTSPLSNEIQATLLPQIPQSIVPTARDKAVVLEWDIVPGALSYNVYIAAETGVTPQNYTQLKQGRMTEDAQSPLTIDGLVNHQTYYYIITAVNLSGESVSPPEQEVMARNPAPIATGTDHTCAIKADFSLACWGLNDQGQLGIGLRGVDTNKNSPTNLGVAGIWSELTAGGKHSCAINTEGTMHCWGDNFDGQLGAANTANFLLTPQVVSGSHQWLDVAAGDFHTCGINNAGETRCWGYGGDGQLGNGGFTATYVNAPPVAAINSNLPWKSIDAGIRHTCGIKDDASLWCWGVADNGQIGSTQNQSLPFNISGLWNKVATGGQHTCAINSIGAMHCWGSNLYGQLGSGNVGLVSSEIPQAVTATGVWIDVAAGSNHTCGVKDDGSLWCWGFNAAGQLGLSGAVQQDKIYQPGQVGTDTSWVSLRSNGDHTCAYQNDGNVWCWGANDQGQLGSSVTPGSGTSGYAVVPTLVNADTNWASLVLGASHSCAIKNNGELWCWGDNFYSAVGNDSQVDQPSPVRIGQDTWISISANNNYSCGIKTDNTLWCWGSNSSSRLGLVNAPTLVRVPNKVGLDTDWAQVSSGLAHACAIKTDGSLHCWGSGSSGKLGIAGSVATQPVPTAVTSTLSWKSVSAGASHTCAISADNTLYCWGLQTSAQTGRGIISINQLEPLALDLSPMTSNDWSSVVAGNTYTCGIKRAVDATSSLPTDELMCWGRNFDGQAGNGTFSTVELPTLVVDQPTNWRHVSNYTDHTCAVKNDNSLWCWGLEYRGRLGTGRDLGLNLTDNFNRPQLLAGNDWQTVEAGSSHSCAIKQGGTLWCWGKNDNGQLGDSSASSDLPTVVVFP